MLRTEDGKINAECSGLLCLARSKADQEGQGSHGWLGPDIVRRVRARFDAHTDAQQVEMRTVRAWLRTLSAASSVRPSCGRTTSPGWCRTGGPLRHARTTGTSANSVV